MKKSYYLIAVVGIMIVLFGILLFLRGDEDTWICSNGQWIKHGNPSASKPTTECTQTTNNEASSSSNR